ncbi:MAG: chromosome segregation protein SMC [Alphaproteobacteria bacterium]|nr:chromosome segregation protein SMC [Alphaproteobacteria bacterium]
MQITRLRLLGFKSFVEPTELLVEPGLTGVVGPNGCGKSNLLEALRWAMGETSYKSMRGQAMDDVIFAGSESRPSRNTAEVTLFIDNSDRTAPAEFNDSDMLEVTRRIEREIGSVYRVNGKDSRARDVRLLFEDAATGARSPALVRQGRIGEIVNAQPQERRRVLEDAAGIAGLHSRRHEAELRLKATEGNLARLSDLIGQLAAQLQAIKRQARQAQRYREVSAKMREVEALLHHLHWTGACAQVEHEEAAFQEALAAVARETKTEGEALRHQAVAAEKLQPLRDEEAAKAAVLHRLSVERDALEREEARAKARQAELETRLAQASRDLAREEEHIAEAENMLRGLEEEARRLAESPLDQEEMQRRQAAESAGKAKLAGLKTELAKLTASVEAIETSLASAELDEEKARAAEGKLRAASAAAKLASQERETELATLIKLLQPPHDWSPVVEAVKVTPGYEQALGAALGDDLDAASDEQAPAHWRGTEGGRSDPALPEGATPLSDFVKAPKVLHRRLAQIGVVPAKKGRDLQAKLAPGQRLVSQDGDLWRWDGYSVKAGTETAAGARLMERSRLAALRTEAQAAQAQAKAALAEYEAAVGKAEAAGQKTKALRQEAKDAHAELDRVRDAIAAETVLEGHEREINLRQERLEAIAAEQELWQKRIANAKEQIATLRAREEETSADLERLANLPAEIDQRRAKLLDSIAAAERDRGKAADNLALAETALKEHEKALREVQEQLAAAREARARSEARLEGARERRSDTSKTIRDQLDCAPEACLALAKVKEGAPLPALEEVEARLAKLRGDRERLGGVNLMAEEEEAELSAKLEEMEREKADVEQAIARLRQGIASLNREGRKRLLEAFDSVNGHFGKLFKTLFGGGSAELKLVDSDDPLESGLEIMATPPGKRAQVLTLLSGGEKALTALALIFAVFLTNPSPICVLDEVDAPLDDANVERFCQLMEEMARQTDTRFLIITHHPLTMSRMSRLYGVTMAERGVSQLVSVDLETAARLRDAS